jgi:hypothetical protein
MKFLALSHNEKLEVKKQLLEFVDILGGLNSFFKLLESIKEAKQFPLLNKTGKYHFPNGTIVWNKEIYKDKIDAIANILKIVDNQNILDTTNIKLKKAILNSIRTLGNLNFIISTKESKEYIIKPFITIDETTVFINPLFQIIFFDNISNTKKILKYK